ncbi:MAG: helix-turn-helix transcriptional regulator [Gillisia sp.]
MKQPELGRKISELRKEKGLTQEELVDKCNISVRDRIGLQFPYDKEMVKFVKQINDATWDDTLKAWHIPFTIERMKASLNFIPISLAAFQSFQKRL